MLSKGISKTFFKSTILSFLTASFVSGPKNRKIVKNKERPRKLEGAFRNRKIEQS